MWCSFDHDLKSLDSQDQGSVHLETFKVEKVDASIPKAALYTKPL